jgi:tetratricopeptide (TPR) repeat protein
MDLKIIKKESDVEVSFLTPGEQLKRLRKVLNVNQVDLEIAGVSRSFISRVEKNERKLSPDVGLKILNIFKEKANQASINLDVDYEYIILSSKEAARLYCDKALNAFIDLNEVNELIEIATKYELNELIYKIYTLKGDILYNNKEYEEAFICYFNVLEFYKENSDYSRKVYIYNKIGKCKFLMFDYIEALSFFKKAYDEAMILNESNTIKNSLYNIALTYKRLEKSEDSLVYIDNFINICNASENINEYISGIIIKANCYIDKGESNKTIELYKSVLQSLNNIPEVLVGYIYNNMALAYLELNKLEDSLDYFDKAIDIRESSDIENLSHTLIDKSKVFIKKDLLGQACELIHKGLNLSIKYKDKEYIMKAYKLLEGVYIKTNDIGELEKIYINMVDILREKNNKEDLLIITSKLALLSLDNNKYDMCRLYLKQMICEENFSK